MACLLLFAASSGCLISKAPKSLIPIRAHEAQQVGSSLRNGLNIVVFISPTGMDGMDLTVLIPARSGSAPTERPKAFAKVTYEDEITVEGPLEPDRPSFKNDGIYRMTIRPGTTVSRILSVEVSIAGDTFTLLPSSNRSTDSQ